MTPSNARSTPPARTRDSRARQAADTRARLLTAARAVFEEKGYRSSSVAEIVKRAEVAHGTFYHYFKSREEVFRVIAEEAQERLHNAFASARDLHPDHSLAERLGEGIAAFFASYRDQVQIMRAVEEVSRYDPELRAMRNRRLRGLVDDAASVIALMQTRGTADPTLDPTLTAAIVGSITLRFPETWLVDAVIDFDFDVAVDHVTRVLVNALGAAQVDQHSSARPRPLRASAS